MTTILIRTLIVYVMLTLSVRFMGKRQMGELQISEFVITLIISELASYPVMDSEIPLLFAFIPIITLISAEVFVSYLCTKNKVFRTIIEPRATILIAGGEIIGENLAKVRITLEELVGEARLKGCPNLADVDYAVLEGNGKISFILKGEKQQPTVAQAGLAPENTGIAHPVVTDGELNLASIAEAGKTPEWVMKKAAEAGFSGAGDIFLMLVDAGDNVAFRRLPKEKKQ